MRRRGKLMAASLPEMCYHATNMKLPPEPELSAQFGASRATIRQAVTNPVQRGMLVRKQGSGTYASRPTAEEDFLNFSFPDRLTCATPGAPLTGRSCCPLHTV